MSDDKCNFCGQRATDEQLDSLTKELEELESEIQSWQISAVQAQDKWEKLEAENAILTQIAGVGPEPFSFLKDLNKAKDQIKDLTTKLADAEKDAKYRETRIQTLVDEKYKLKEQNKLYALSADRKSLVEVNESLMIQASEAENEIAKLKERLGVKDD